MAEWLKAHAWNACRRATVSRVRIPPSPPDPFQDKGRADFFNCPPNCPPNNTPREWLAGRGQGGRFRLWASLRLGSNWQNIGRLENGGRQPLGGMTAEDFAFEGDGVARGLSTGPRFFSVSGVISMEARRE